MILSFPMAVLLGCSGIGGPDYEPFVDSYVIEEKISDESYRVYRFDLPTSGRDFSLSGWFKVTSGGSHDINAYVVDATEFTNFRSGNNFYPLFHEIESPPAGSTISLCRENAVPSISS